MLHFNIPLSNQHLHDGVVTAMQDAKGFLIFPEHSVFEVFTLDYHYKEIEIEKTFLSLIVHT